MASMTSLLEKWRHGLEHTRKSTFARLSSLLGTSEINAQTWDDLEALLLEADVGMDVTRLITQDLKAAAKNDGITRADQLHELLAGELLSLLPEPPALDLDAYHPAVILLVGVNGSGKTTTAAKLAGQLTKDGKKVVLGAADTYRAAAVDQLQEWGERLNLPVVAGQPEGDPGAVAYDAVQAALARGSDYLIVDTAGRLHTRYNLMEELKKVRRVIAKALPGAPHATWLVLDATNGQNAIAQARAFREAVSIDGVVLAKLDSSARGGMAFAIQRELGVPILYVGLGEKAEDLQPFDRQAFVDGLLG
jgi:fused signal recognition particle receptor